MVAPVVVEEKVEAAVAIQRDPIDHAGRPAAVRIREERFQQEQENQLEVVPIAAGDMICVLVATEDGVEDDGSGMDGVPLGVAKVLPFDASVLDTTQPDALLPVAWYISAKPILNKSRGTLYDRKWRPWIIKGKKASANRAWEGTVPRKTVLLVGPLFTASHTFTSAVKAKLEAIDEMQHNLSFSTFSAYKTKKTKA